MLKEMFPYIGMFKITIHLEPHTDPGKMLAMVRVQGRKAPDAKKYDEPEFQDLPPVTISGTPEEIMETLASSTFYESLATMQASAGGTGIAEFDKAAKEAGKKSGKKSGKKAAKTATKPTPAKPKDESDAEDDDDEEDEEDEENTGDNTPPEDPAITAKRKDLEERVADVEKRLAEPEGDIVAIDKSLRCCYPMIKELRAAGALSDAMIAKLSTLGNTIKERMTLKMPL